RRIRITTPRTTHLTIATITTSLLLTTPTSCRKPDPPPDQHIPNQESSTQTTDSQHNNKPNDPHNNDDPNNKPTNTNPTNKQTIHGTWSKHTFTAKSAFVSVFPHWMTITVLNRQAQCHDAKPSNHDLAIQLSIPSGPNNDFFHSKDIPTEVRLHGAGGISKIPPSHATIHINPFNPESDTTLSGYIRIQFHDTTTHNTPQTTPTYSAEGSLTATVCNNQKTTPSIPNLPTNQPSSGTIANQPTKLTSTHAYTRDNGFGRTILVLKAFEDDTPCHSIAPKTPYMFGAEIGPNRHGNYVLGTPLPSNWAMRIKANGPPKRTIQTPIGASWIQLNTVDLRENGTVTGILAVDNSDDDPLWQFSISGEFDAKFCGPEQRVDE
ncbi:MAG: hypothetical protein FWD57_14815, partial [Polyangiaceae bacterium]|nr:hypothetical protein [Polyangiaceae bacterium]